MGDFSPDRILDMYIHDYMVRWNLTESAEVFARASNLRPRSRDATINAPGGYLLHAFCRFWNEYYAEVARRGGTIEGYPPQVDREIARQVMERMLQQQQVAQVMEGHANADADAGVNGKRHEQ